MKINVEFNFNMDTPKGLDPDRYSPTLRKYHKNLWCRPLPDGTLFKLDDDFPNYYLSHKSRRGFFELSSDAITNTYLHTKKLISFSNDISQLERESFYAQSSTIGGYILFPARKIGRKPTINGARGINRQVGDRFDLTLECIRRHYLQEQNPLQECIARYAPFFDLFVNFSGYVEFFDLQDLVDESLETIKFILPFKGFMNTPYPTTIEEYSEYRHKTLNFVASRNARISKRMN